MAVSARLKIWTFAMLPWNQAALSLAPTLKLQLV